MTAMVCVLRLGDLSVIDDDEPRILDLRIAERLGFDRPRNIRKLVDRHREEFERHGTLLQHGAKPTGGRPTREFWLNEAQAILVCMKSETPRAEDVRAEIIAVFRAYRHGQLVPSAPLTADVIGAVFDQRLAPVHSKLDEHSIAIREIGTNVVRIERRVDEIVPRRNFSEDSRRQYRETILQFYGGFCPLHRRVRIVNDDGTPTAELEYDHFNGREMNSVEDGWPLSREAHDRLHRDAEFKNKARAHFAVFHDNRRELLGNRRGTGKSQCRGTIPDGRQGNLL